jgi:hypothetical protein
MPQSGSKKVTNKPTNTTPTPAPKADEPAAKPVDASPDKELAAAPVNSSPAHEVDEDPEQHLGDVIDDPWHDDSQTDWPSGSVEVNN